MEQARWERGIGVAELARRVGVDRKRLWRVLNGERAMRADEFVRLCAELRVGLADFAAPTRPR
ncbi:MULTISPECIES: helix-turn-helix domain-containing protein [Gordonibacter]|uniref:Helix-turn-helix transcriptional regulator n=1 Tax=Gordonibacter faecis TaxID=3047475 RepID=A0ABT7DKI1_9ACTN|nr:helix-turn-helix transcriptional regulator [Gordonibacter sp. KGMB12511]MDJ1650035.1 helix-turn-helix transcriptional regulator [Gordonibacter sp. KGMB12511]